MSITQIMSIGARSFVPSRTASDMVALRLAMAVTPCTLAKGYSLNLVELVRPMLL